MNSPRVKKPTDNKSRQDDLAKIHIAKQQLGMDDETYRSMLWTIARVRSSANLDFQQRRKVLDHLISRGWKPQPPKAAGTKRPLANTDQIKMIRGLWLQLHELHEVRDPSEAAMNRFAKNQMKIDRLEWLKVDQASKVIEMLKQWVARVEAKNGSA